MRYKLAAFIACMLLTLTGFAAVQVVVTEHHSSISKPLISTSINNDTYLIGSRLVIDKTTTIQGDVVLVAGYANVQGNIQGNTTIIAGQITLSGHFTGDVTVIGGNIDIKPETSIDGSLKYINRSSIDIEQGAAIKGDLKNLAIYKADKEQRLESVEPSNKPSVAFYLGLFIVGLIGCVLFTQYSDKLVVSVRQRRWLALVTGLVTLTVIPIFILTSLITIIGIPFAMILLVMYIASLWFAYTFAAWILGVGSIKLINSKAEFGKRWIRIIALAIGTGILYWIGYVPILGFWFKLIALLIGLGGIVLALMSSRNPVVITK